MEEIDAPRLFERCAWTFREVLLGVEEEHLDVPTPCAPLTVRELVPRAIGHQTWVRRRIAGRSDAPDYGMIERRDWLTAYDDSTAGMLATLADPDALTRRVELAAGIVHPGAEVAVLAARNIFQFGWDLAVGTDQDPDLSPDLAEELLELSRTRFVPQRGPGGFFGPESVPAPGSPVATVLAGYLGRDV